MHVSCDADCLSSVTLFHALRDIAAAGFTAVDVSVDRVRRAFEASASPAEDARRLLDRFGASAVAATIRPLAGATPETMAADVDRLLQDMRFAHDLGVETVSTRAGDRRIQALPLLLGGLEEVAAHALGLGVAVHVANADRTRLEQLEDVRALLAALQAPNVALRVDVGAFHDAAVNPADVLRENPGRVGAIRLADRRGGADVPLGEGETNVRAVVDRARRTGFDGRWIVCPRIDEPAQAPAALARVRERLAELLASAQ